MNIQNIVSQKTIFQTIGNTPLIELKRYSPHPRVKIMAKLEGTNPGGSVKDRIARAMIFDAIDKKLLGSKEILEPTSGNTGIGIAMIAAALGYKFTAVIPESVSLERRKLLQMYGAQLILTDGPKGTNYAIQVAHEIIKKEAHRFIMLDQFNNNANVMAHYETTGLEILQDVPYVTHFVAGMGTGGTLMGVGRRLKEYNSSIKIIGVEPKEGSKIQGLRNMKAYTPSIYNEEKLDEVLHLADDETAFELARDIFKKEGVSVGISSGAALWGAIKVAEQLKEGTIVTVFPDRGDRYVSTPLFA